MCCEDDFVEISEKECNLEAAFDCRLVSHAKNALSVDRVPGDSLRIVARPLDSAVSDYAGTLLAAANLAPTEVPQGLSNRVRKSWKEWQQQLPA
jgi:hypothetical protein